MNPPYFPSPAECGHPALHFASGGYYLVCADCGASWVAHQPGADSTPDPARAKPGLDSNQLRVSLADYSQLPSVVERCARAAYAAADYNVDHWDGLTGTRWRLHVEERKPRYRKIAAAVLAAFRA